MDTFRKLGLNDLNGVTAQEIVRTTTVPQNFTFHELLAAENQRFSLACQRAGVQTKRQKAFRVTP